MALWAEGTTDGPFLRPLLRRVVQHRSIKWNAAAIAEDFLGLPDPSPQAGRADRICAAVKERPGEIDILFIHADGGGQPERAMKERVIPAIELINQLSRKPDACIGVVPRHETEAWMLADRDALADALGVIPDRLSGFPDIDEVERESDPKRLLQSIRTDARQGRRRIAVPSLDLNRIGEAVCLDRLRSLNAFQAFERQFAQLDKIWG